MKLVYIAGPRVGSDFHQTERHIGYAREWAEKLARAGHAFYSPQLNTAHFDAVAPDIAKDFWREMDLKILRRCDAVLVLPGCDEEEATKRDIHFANTWGIPLAIDIEEIEGLPPSKAEQAGS